MRKCGVYGTDCHGECQHVLQLRSIQRQLSQIFVRPGRFQEQNEAYMLRFFFPILTKIKHDALSAVDNVKLGNGLVSVQLLL